MNPVIVPKTNLGANNGFQIEAFCFFFVLRFFKGPKRIKIKNQMFLFLNKVRNKFGKDSYYSYFNLVLLCNLQNRQFTVEWMCKPDEI